jgi:hypothetical protein
VLAFWFENGQDDVMSTPAGTAVAAVVGSLSPGNVGKDFTTSDKAFAQIPHDWQMLGASYQWAELHGAISGLPNGYAADLIGRAAAAGEQLALAFAAVRDAEVWRDTSVRPVQASRRSIAGRGMAEASGLWAVSAGHAITNVASRVVRLHKLASDLDKKLKWSVPPAPFDPSPKANLSINTPTVNSIMSVAKRTAEPALIELVQPLDVLVSSAAWRATTARRDAGYHRLRPQSLAGGVPARNPWSENAATGSTTMSVYESATYVPPALEEVVAEARAGYNALSLCMDQMLKSLPTALDAVGVPIFKI